MEINQIIEWLNVKDFIAIGIKLFGIVFAVFYVFFSLIIIKQAQIMKKTIEIKDMGLLSLLAIIQLILSIIILLYALFLL